MYAIRFTNSQPEATAATYEDAIIIATEGLGEDAVYEHDGDLTDGGDRTLVWASEADAENDDGAKAHASIRRA